MLTTRKILRARTQGAAWLALCVKVSTRAFFALSCSQAQSKKEREKSAKEKKCEIAVLLLLHLNLLRQGHPWLWSRDYGPQPRRSSFVSLALACACWAAGCRLPWAHARNGMGVAKVEMDGQQEKSKRSRPPRVSKTTLPQPPAARQARYCWPLSLPHGGGVGAVTGCRAGRLSFILTLYTGEGSGEKGWWWKHSWYRHPYPTGAELHLKQDYLYPITYQATFSLILLKNLNFKK
jgi:hypothetical protein